MKALKRGYGRRSRPPAHVFCAKFLNKILGVWAFALAGVFAAIAHQVAQRRTEIAVRLAIGAGMRNVVGLFVMRSVWAAAAGAAEGIALADVLRGS